MSKIFSFIAVVVLILVSFKLIVNTDKFKNPIGILTSATPASTNPLSIDYLRSRKYQGSDIKIEETLNPGSNYNRYIVSFVSDGLKEFAYMTVPKTQKPGSGFPVIIFNHGYQVPELYTPDGNYIAYMDALAKSGYIVFKPDYRGNGKSEGAPGSTYFSANYIIDDLNAIASIKKYPDANPNKIGVWGHSMGGSISLKVTEIADIKATVIWGGVVGSYTDIIYNWQNKVSYKPDREDLYLRNLTLAELLAANGTPSQNPGFWNSIDPTFQLKYIKTPVQLHVGLSDNQVPPEFSKSLYKKLADSGKNVEYFEYPGANHDINQSFSLAMKRTVDFYDKYLK